MKEWTHTVHKNSILSYRTLTRSLLLNLQTHIHTHLYIYHYTTGLQLPLPHLSHWDKPLCLNAAGSQLYISFSCLVQCMKKTCKQDCQSFNLWLDQNRSTNTLLLYFSRFSRYLYFTWAFSFLTTFCFSSLHLNANMCHFYHLHFQYQACCSNFNAFQGIIDDFFFRILARRLSNITRLISAYQCVSRAPDVATQNNLKDAALRTLHQPTMSVFAILGVKLNNRCWALHRSGQ